VGTPGTLHACSFSRIQSCRGRDDRSSPPPRFDCPIVLTALAIGQPEPQLAQRLAFNPARPDVGRFSVGKTYRGGFLVTDGHLNRVLRVTLDGEVTVLIAFDDIVPTGLAVSGNTIYMAEAGPVPHQPQDGTSWPQAPFTKRS
jgi:hypothetical protein